MAILFGVTLRVLGATTVHLLKMPSAKDVFEYRHGFARLLDLPFGRQEVTINIGPVAAIAHWSGWTPPSARKKACSSGALSI